MDITKRFALNVDLKRRADLMEWIILIYAVFIIYAIAIAKAGADE